MLIGFCYHFYVIAAASMLPLMISNDLKPSSETGMLIVCKEVVDLISVAIFKLVLYSFY